MNATIEDLVVTLNALAMEYMQNPGDRGQIEQQMIALTMPLYDHGEVIANWNFPCACQTCMSYDGDYDDVENSIGSNK